MIDPAARFFWWKTGGIRRIDLLAIVQELRIGFSFCPSQLTRRKDRQPLAIGSDQGIIRRGFLL
jgi:hypothetical protein